MLRKCQTEQPQLNKGANREIDKPCEAEGEQLKQNEIAEKNSTIQQIFSSEMTQDNQKKRDRNKKKQSEFTKAAMSMQRNDWEKRTHKERDDSLDVHIGRGGQKDRNSRTIH